MTNEHIERECSDCGDSINSGVMFGNGEVSCFDCYDKKTRELEASEFPL